MLEMSSHSSTREDAREEFSCWVSSCPGSYVRDIRNVLLPAFCAEEINCSLLHSYRVQMLHETTQAQVPWRRCQVGILCWSGAVLIAM